MRRKRIFGIVLSALLIIPTFLSLIRLSGYVFATSISEAESICNQLGGKFLDNSQSEGAQNGSEDAAKCSQIPNSSDPNKKTICESSEGSYSVNTQTCNWRYVDDITVEHSAAALKTLCESNSGTFTDLSASHNEATCHNLPHWPLPSLPLLAPIPLKKREPAKAQRPLVTANRARWAGFSARFSNLLLAQRHGRTNL